MKILVHKDNQLLKEIQLIPGKLLSVGRKEDCDIVLEKLPGISREHFEIDEDGAGHWRVNVLSEVLLIQYNGEDRKSLTLKGSGEFLLGPYQFKFIHEENSQSLIKEPTSNTPAPLFNELEDSLANPSEDETDDEIVSPLVPLKSFEGDDENTSVQNFNGAPYIKIIGQNGKKSEYFRLEGNLWVVGGHESASLFINEVGASQNHFEISKTDKGFFIIDSGSSMGTELNGQRLKNKKAVRLSSGDIITVGSTTLQFELRDNSFKRKVSNIPLSMYKNPLVFFDQNVALVNFDNEKLEAGSVEEVSSTLFADKNKRKRFIMVALTVVVVCVAAISQLTEQTNNTEGLQKSGLDPFSQLSEAEQKMVIQTHKLAKQLYLAGNFELALGQLEKLHNIIPVYKDSQEMQEYCINSRELKRQQAQIEQQKQEQIELENQVASLMAQCNQQYQNSDDIDGVKACLAPAMDLDPNNPGISQLISEVTARKEEKTIREKIAQEQEDRIQRGKELFEKARLLHNQQNYLQAMEAYENHIHSGLPDPKNLVKTSRRNLANIEWKIKTEKNQLVGQAQSKYGSTHLKDAILLGRKAQRVDPYDPEISNFVFKVEKELTNKMRNIYKDSMIEEGFGNLEACRVKWEEIVKTDVPDGEYYKKARRKLRQYGYQP